MWKDILAFTAAFTQGIVPGVVWPCLTLSPLTATRCNILAKVISDVLPPQELAAFLAELYSSPEWKRPDFVSEQLVALLKTLHKTPLLRLIPEQIEAVIA